MKGKKVTVIIPCYNEEKYIEYCLLSVLDFEYPKDLLEIIVVDGNSTDQTKKLVEGFVDKSDFIHLVNNPYRTQPYAFNLGIQHSSGEYIAVISAHATYEKDYIKKLIDWHQKLDAMNIGGLIITDTLNDKSKSIAIRKVLSHRFGVGNALFRTGVNHAVKVDTVAFGCYKKECFEKYGLFDQRLTRNQDIEYNKRIVNGGDHIYLVPNVQASYYARETWGRLSQNNFQNGMWNILTLYYTKDFKSLSLRHFIPLLFVLSLMLPILFCLLSKWILLVSLVSFFSYFLLIVWFSLKLNSKNTSIIHLSITFIVLHISYGLGSLFGILKLPFLKNN